jgi:hypothetical protein
LVRHSPTFRDLIRDIFSGAQNYRGLKRRLWQQFGITMAEFGRSFLDPRRALAPPHRVNDREAAR